MRFLLSAKRMSKGMARLRHVMILTARTLAIAGLIFAISRPLATGWFGALGGGKPETIVVLLDRSASMQQQELATGISKTRAGLEKIADMVNAFDGSQKIVLIDSATNRPFVVDSADSLLDLAQVRETETSANIPEMMQVALDYITENESGRTDVWLCSDGQRGDWNEESSQWSSVRSAYSKLEGVRFNLLNYAESAKQNYSVVVENVSLVKFNERNELSLDIIIRRKDFEEQTQVPVEVSINGVRSVVNARIESDTYELRGHRIPIDADMNMGWGKVELPADSNAGDNFYYFSFADQSKRKTLIVSENASEVEPLRFICSASMDAGVNCQAEVVAPEMLNGVDWNEFTMLLWHAPLPKSTNARQVKNFLDSGRSVVFFPPESVDETSFAGAKWTSWEAADSDEPQSIGFWKNDDGALRKTQNGKALPLDEIKVYRYCSLNASGRALAKLENGTPLVLQQESDIGNAYFCSTLPKAQHSSLSRNGIVLYAFLHRILQGSSEYVGGAKQLVAGSSVAKAQLGSSQKIKTISSIQNDRLGDRNHFAGVYGTDDSRSDSIQEIYAVNRPVEEDSQARLAPNEIKELFADLDYRLIDDQIGNKSSLASEIWKAFVVLVGIALLTETILCLPRKPESANSGVDASGSTHSLSGGVA